VVGEVSLKRGRWCYEVRILETDPSTPSESGCVGWADSKLFFGDSSKGIGVGDGPTSWGLIVQDMRASGGCPGRKRSGKVTEEWGKPVHQGVVVTCAVSMDEDGTASFLFGLDGDWEAPVGEAFTGVKAPSGGFCPAFSLRSDAKLQINFGDRPFEHKVPEGFLPIASHASKQVPSWLQYLVPAKPEPTPQPKVAPAAAAMVMPLLLLQMDTALQLVQIEVARQEERDPTLEGIINKMTCQMSRLKQHINGETAEAAEASPSAEDAPLGESSGDGKEEGGEEEEQGSTEEKVEQLVGMLGVGEPQARQALGMCGGSIEMAVTILLGS